MRQNHEKYAKKKVKLREGVGVGGGDDVYGDGHSKWMPTKWKMIPSVEQKREIILSKQKIVFKWGRYR